MAKRTVMVFTNDDLAPELASYFEYDLGDKFDIVNMFGVELRAGCVVRVSEDDDPDRNYHEYFAKHDDFGWWLCINLIEHNRRVDWHALPMTWKVEA